VTALVDEVFERAVASTTYPYGGHIRQRLKFSRSIVSDFVFNWVSPMSRQSGGRNATCNENLGRDDGHWSRSCIFYDGRNVLTDDIQRTGNAPDSKGKPCGTCHQGSPPSKSNVKKISPSVWATRCPLGSKADMCTAKRHVCFTPEADIAVSTQRIEVIPRPASIVHTVRYTELSPSLFKSFWCK
jgi:hypothetical protein